MDLSSIFFEAEREYKETVERHEQEKAAIQQALEQERAEKLELQQSLGESEANLDAVMEEIETNGMLHTFLERARLSANHNKKRAVWAIEKHLHKKARKDSPWIAEQWRNQDFTQFEPGASLFSSLQLTERLGKRTNPKPGSNWYGVNASVYSATPNATSKLPSSHKLSVRLLYGYDSDKGATLRLEQNFDEVLSFANLRRGHFLPHSNILPVLHHWIERNVPFPTLPSFDAEIDVIGTHAAMSLSPQCSCNLEQMLSQRKVALDEYEVIHIGGSVASGLNHLFNNKIVHRDLKLDNILLYWWNTERDLEHNELHGLIEYRIPQSIPIVHDLDEHLSLHGTEHADEMKIPCIQGLSKGGAQTALSPEVLAAKPQTDRYISYLKNDAWALGVVLYQMLHHPNHKTSLPYAGEQWYRRSLTELQDIPALTIEGLPGDYSARLKQLVCDLLQPDPAKRLSLADALQRFDNLSSRLAPTIVSLLPTQPTQDQSGLLPPISSV